VAILIIRLLVQISECSQLAYLKTRLVSSLSVENTGAILDKASTEGMGYATDQARTRLSIQYSDDAVLESYICRYRPPSLVESYQAP